MSKIVGDTSQGKARIHSDLTNQVTFIAFEMTK